ncbi:MAG: B12-binding domain-containing radical SAM protein [Chloroflexi bacterium]|nr:B12-binding domain-containing radical SAM protein [Chloroflexota bacterium]
MSVERIVLIQPCHQGTIWGKAAGSPYTLMRLASMVPQAIPVEIWDENLGPLDYARLNSNTLVGISSMTVTIDGARAIAEQAQQRGSKVVVGGVHATLVPDDVARWSDSVAVGEAYHTWQRIIADFEANQLAPRYTDEAWESLDHLAPISQRVIDLTDEHRNYWTPSLEITRGCPRNCTFCTAIRVSGKIMRLRPVDQIVEEIERRRLKRFFLTDDNFGLNFRLHPKYMEQLFRALAKLPIDSWSAQSEMMVAEFPTLLALAREAHLDKFFIGFESVNSGNRRDLGGKSKGQIEEYKRAIRAIHAHGIAVVGLFVTGFDHDTPNVFGDTWNFVRDSELDSVSATVLTPFPETPQRAELIQQKRLLPNVPWRHYDTAHVTFHPALMTAAQLRSGYDWLCRQLYSPRAIALRGLRTLRRHPLHRARAKAFASFSTDLGYRKAYGLRAT